MRSENDNSDQNSLEVKITASNYYGGKILCRSKPSLDVEDAKKDSRLIAMFGQADVNSKMTALAQGYEDIDLPKKVKGLAVFLAVLAAIGVIMTLVGEASESIEFEGGGHHEGEGQHENDEEVDMALIIFSVLFFSSFSVFLVFLCKAGREVISRQDELVKSVFADWSQRGVVVRYDPGQSGGEHSAERFANVTLQLPNQVMLQQAMPTVMVQVPMGALPGTQLSVQVNGSMMSVVIPPGCQPGSSFPVQVAGLASTI